MTSLRRKRTTARGRRGSALILVLMLTFALAALAGSAILLSSTANLSTKSREGEKDLRYAADAAVAVGESQVQMNPTALPNTGYTQMATNAAMLAADSTPVPGITYNLYGGITGSATRQNGRFITLVAQAMDSARHRTFIRHIELAQESFAKFAYFSNNENGICFGSGDILYGPVFSNGNISTCGSPQKATFDDSVGAAGTVTNGNSALDTFYLGYKQNQAPIALPNTTALNGLFARAAVGGTAFTSPNSNTDSTGIVKSRLEFVAYNTTSPVSPDSTAAGEGFVKFYALDPTKKYWASNVNLSTAHLRDSAEGSYLRSGINHVADWHNCGDWHYVADSVVTPVASQSIHYSWQFFPAAVHDSGWFQTVVSNGGILVHGQHHGWYDGGNVLHWFMKDSTSATPAYGLDSNFMRVYDAAHLGLGSSFVRESLAVVNAVSTATRWQLWLSVITPSRDASAASPEVACYPGGDPHLVSIERTDWIDSVATNPGYLRGYGWRGGTDSTYTYGVGGPGLQMPSYAGVGLYTMWPIASPITYPSTSWGTPSLTWKTHHADWPALFPLDSVYNPAFQGVVAVHGTTAISGNVDAHVTVYTDGSMGMIDNLRLVTDESDTLCKHGMGIVAGNDITALDNPINVPQHWMEADANSSTGTNFVTLRPGSFGGSLYVESTVMSLGSWGAEGLNADTDYVSSVLCPASAPPDNIYKRGCLYVFGSIIQNLRVTVNSGSGGAGGYGYSKRYQYDICAVKNPLPYFPTTGRLVLNKYYEHDPNHFNVSALYSALALP
jgi:Tfp pilus assembly protein PilX